MIDVFNFPSCYKADVHMGKENFIANGNLTDAGRMKLSNCLLDVNVLYGIQCLDDSEIVVLGVAFDYQERSVTRDYVSNIMATIASALPYRSLIYAERKGKARIYTFDGRLNKQDSNRMYIAMCHCTPTFDPINPPAMIKKLVGHLGETLTKHNSADDVNRMWNYYMNDDTDGVDIVRARENF